jgi:hypothetical protein
VDGEQELDSVQEVKGGQELDAGREPDAGPGPYAAQESDGGQEVNDKKRRVSDERGMGRVEAPTDIKCIAKWHMRPFLAISGPHPSNALRNNQF